jgi:predicted kinase
VRVLIVLAGLPGTGKSTLARAVADRIGGAVLNKDLIRPALFAPTDVEYSVQQDDFCMSVMLAAAGYLWRKDPGRAVFLDGRTFSREYQIRTAIHHAERLDLPWRIIECVCREETAKLRLKRDLTEGCHPAQNRDPALYDAVRAHFEPIRLEKLVVDTDRDIEECVRECAEYVTS